MRVMCLANHAGEHTAEARRGLKVSNFKEQYSLLSLMLQYHEIDDEKMCLLHNRKPG